MRSEPPKLLVTWQAKKVFRADGDGNEHHQQRHHIHTAEVKHRNKREKENEHEMQDNIAEMAESDCWA
jgi:hypothetical protein